MPIMDVIFIFTCIKVASIIHFQFKAVQITEAFSDVYPDRVKAVQGDEVNVRGTISAVRRHP